jgi:photosystem II stability/assembly factor-like uncharacterized protein
MSMVILVRAVLLFLALLVSSAAVFAGQNVWTTSGPVGSVTALGAGAAGVFAGAADGRVGFRSVDHGASWTVIGEVPIYWSVSAFSLDSMNPTDVYAAANSYPFDSAIYRSEDRGNSWAHVASLRGNVLALAVRPDRPGSLYGGFSSCYCYGFPCFLHLTCSGEVRTSADFGMTWDPPGTGLAGSAISSLAFDPVDPNRIYAASVAGVFVSTDAGDHWSAANAGLQCGPVLALAIRPPDGVLFAGTACGGVFRSDDGGQSWRSTGLPSHYIKSLVIDPANPQTIYAGAGSFVGFSSPGGGVFRSEDGGETWALFGSGLPPRGVDRLVIEPSGLRLHASTSEGVFDYEIVPGARPPIVPPRARETRTVPARP